MKRKVRVLFGLVIFFFVLGLLVTKIIDEPYPAIIYPSFATIPTVSRSLKEPRLKVFFRNQDSLQISTTDLFYGMSKNFVSVILKENFTQRNSFLTRLKNQNDVKRSI